MPSRDDWCRASQRMAGVRKLQPDPPYADARHGPHDDRGRSLGQHREPANDASGPQSIPARRRGRGHYRADEKRDDVRTRRGIQAQPAIKGGVMRASNLTPCRSCRRGDTCRRQTAPPSATDSGADKAIARFGSSHGTSWGLSFDADVLAGCPAVAHPMWMILPRGIAPVA